VFQNHHSELHHNNHTASNQNLGVLHTDLTSHHAISDHISTALSANLVRPFQASASSSEIKLRHQSLISCHILVAFHAI